MLTFHVGRVEGYRSPGGHLHARPKFHAEAWVRDLFGVETGDEVLHVAVRFDAYQARFMRGRQWHATQAVEDLPDGGIILRFQSSSWGEIRVSYSNTASHAEVLEPRICATRSSRKSASCTRSTA